MKTMFDPKNDKRWGTAINIDCDAINYMMKSHGMNLENLEQKCADWFNEHYKGCGISDILYHIDNVIPVKARQGFADFYVDSLKTGKEIDKTSEMLGKLYNTIYNEMHIDPYQIWFDLCRESGIHPWVSFRMNDTHAPFLGYCCTDFFYKAQANNWLIGMEAGGCEAYSYCMDYAVPEVRDYFLTYIDEMLEKYDVYGLELDWQREMHCFKKESKDNCQYMDIFMADLNKIVEKYEKQYGHEIRIMSRHARDLNGNLYFGFDIVNWAKNGWVDVIVPSSHGCTDSDVPVAEWKAALSPYNVEVYIGFECITIFGHGQKPETLAAFSSMYLQMGVDKVYLYNLFNSEKEYYSVCSTLQAAVAYARHSYIITQQTKMPRLKECVRYIPLPVNVVAGEITAPRVIPHGQMVTDAQAYLYIGLSDKDQTYAEQNGFRVMYNGVPCEYCGAATDPYAGASPKYQCILSFRIPETAWQNASRAEITFAADDVLQVAYVELMNGQPAVG